AVGSERQRGHDGGPGCGRGARCRAGTTVMRRVILDRNVIVSAALTPDGACAEVLDAGRSGRLDVLVTPQLMDDVAGTLVRRLPAADAGRFLWRLRDAATLVADPHRSWPAGGLDPGSAHVVALARARGVDAVVTGHGGLLRADVPGARIVSPRTVLDELATSRQATRPALPAALDRARAAR